MNKILLLTFIFCLLTSLAIATIVTDWGQLKYWLNGRPSYHIGRNNNDMGTMRFWLNGRPEGEIVYPSSRVTQIYESALYESLIN
jgi:hypothetical protein